MDDEMDEWVEMARSHTLADVLSMLDLEVARGTTDEGFMMSIFHDEKTPSMHLTDDAVWHDFSTGKGGDVIGLVQEYFGCSFKRAVMFLATSTDPGAVIEKRSKVARKEEPPPDFFQQVAVSTGIIQNPDVYQRVWQWCDSKWGIGLEYVGSRFGVFPTHDGKELWAPHRWSNSLFGPQRKQIIGVKVRSIPASDKWSLPGSKYLALYSAIEFHEVGATAYLVEGESDTWSLRHQLDLHSSGDEVFGLPSGVGMQRESWVYALSKFDQVRLCLDDDAAGRKGTERWLHLLPKAVAMQVPGGRVAEALAQGWQPWTT